MSNLETKLFDLMTSWREEAQEVASTGNDSLVAMGQAMTAIKHSQQLLKVIQETAVQDSGLDLIL
jgi:hypothetical protein